MRRYRLIFFVLLFALLTALRLGLPDWPRNLREQLWAALSQGEDYAAITEAMGRGLTEEGLREGLIAALGQAGRPAPESSERAEDELVPADQQSGEEPEEGTADAESAAPGEQDS